MDVKLTRRTFLQAAGMAALAGLLGASALGGARPATATAAAAQADTIDGYYPITVTDMGGCEVTIDAAPQSIATLMGGTYDYVDFFGMEDRISVSMAITHNAWRDLIFDPAPEGMVELAVKDCRDPNIEELVNNNVDLVFLWSDLPDAKAAMEELGMKVVQVSSSSTVDTVEDFISEETKLYDLFGKVLNNQEKAERYKQYLTDIVDLCNERTEGLAADERPRVYLSRAEENGLQCFTKGGSYAVMAELAGGTFVPGDEVEHSAMADVTMEQVIEWDPEYVYVCWLDSADGITENEQWAPVSAVKNGHVFVLPAAESSWINVGLWTLYMATTMHPDLFGDIDMVDEVKRFYADFHDFELSDEQAQNVLDRLLPDGSPRS